VAIGVNYVISSLWYRPRPFVLYPHLVHLLVQPAPDASFPSDHAAVAAAAAFALRGQNRLLQAVFWVLTALILLARVFVGVHWPTDVLGGAAVGFVSSSLVLAFAGVLRRPADFLLRLLRVYEPGRAH
jgi:undecaprenyl-diphosphatase